MSTQPATERTSGAALPTTLDDIRDLATIPVFSETGPSYAGLVDRGKGAAYADARHDRIPTVRLGTRVLVPVPALRRLLGDLA